MKQEQLQKNFSELYVGENSGQMVKKYYRKKHKEMLVIMIAGIGLILFSVMYDMKNSQLDAENMIYRSEMQEEEISLQIKNQENDWEDIRVTLYPKEYSEEELDELYVKACEILPHLIQKEGGNLNRVISDLDLPDEIESFPFFIQWESSASEVIDEEGHLLVAGEEYDGIVKLKAIFEYGDWKRENQISVHVKTDKTKDFSLLLEKELEKREEDSRKTKEFYLPERFQGYVLQWRYPPQNSVLLLGVLFFISMPVIAWQKDREIYILAIKRREQLQEEFPEFIARLVLLLEAGVSIRNAIFHIAEDYQKKSYVKKNYLQEELTYICRKMKNGLSEKEGYELLAKRCNLSCYKKLSGMLIQHMQKGGSSILYELRNESLKASEEEKRRLQKRGEEMGTKMLFPMMLMLGIVMIFIMIPALFSFQI